MGLIHTDMFITLDGVAQAPGGPEEDAEGGFAFGGWQAPLWDDDVNDQVGSGLTEMDALLLGRRTYDISSSYWLHEDGNTAQVLNRVPRYVATRQAPILEWHNSTLLGPDVVEAVHELRDRHENTRSSAASISCRPPLHQAAFRPAGTLGVSHPPRQRKEAFCQRSGTGEPQIHRTGRRFAQGRGDAPLPPCQWHTWRRRDAIRRARGLEHNRRGANHGRDEGSCMTAAHRQMRDFLS